MSFRGGSSSGRMSKPVMIGALLATGMVALMFMSSRSPSTPTVRPANSFDEVEQHDRIQAMVSAAVEQQKDLLAAGDAHAGKTFPTVATVPVHKRLRILITGGAGFVGSHLVDRLMMQGTHIVHARAAKPAAQWSY